MVSILGLLHLRVTRAIQLHARSIARRWAGHGSKEIETPQGSPAPGISSLDDCAAACAALPQCDGFLSNSKQTWVEGKSKAEGELCYRKASVRVASCERRCARVHKRGL